MASAKQIAWRKKFARMSKAGKFKKSKFQKTGKKKDMVEGTDYITGKSFSKLLRDANKPTKKPKSKITQKLKKGMRY